MNQQQAQRFASADVADQQNGFTFPPARFLKWGCVVLLCMVAGLMVSERGWGQVYILVTNTSNLVVGENYIIATAQTGTAQVLGFQNTNNRPQATATGGGPFTIVSSVITLSAASASSDVNKAYEIIVNTGIDATHFDLYDPINAKSLVPATGSTTNNYLKGKPSGTSNWTITFSGNAAIITNTGDPNTTGRNVIQYNFSSSLFASYVAASQSSVYLYRKAYTVTYNGNGSTSGSVPTDGSSPYFNGATVTVLGNSGTLARTGYTFGGWNTAADGSGTAYAASATLTISSNTTLYAQWVASGKTVTFNSNGGSGTMSPQNASTATNLTTNAFTKTGYSFNKWNTAANGSGTDYADGASYSFSADITLYAIWTVNNYTVTFDANSASSGSVPSDQNGNYSSSITLSGNTGSLARTGFTFTGWNTASNGSGTHYNTGASFSIPASNTALYAEWTGTVTYSGNGNTGGTAPPNANYFAGATVTAASNSGSLVKSGLTFAGWNTSIDGSGTTYAAGSGTFTMAGNITLFARWISAPCFSEDFASASSGDNTSTGGSGVIWSGNANFPTVATAYQAGGAVKLGSGSAAGSITSAALSGVSGNVSLSIDVKGWSTVEGDVTVTLNGVSQTITYTAVMSSTSFDTKTLSFTAVPAGSTLKIETTTKRAFVDNIILICTPITPTPEINLKQGSTSFATTTVSAGSDTYDFGNQPVSTSGTAVTFTIENTGTASLSLTGSPIVAKSGINASEFTIVQATTSSSVADSGSTTFTVAFNPSAVGTRTAVLTIANDDSDENPYVINIKGTGINSLQSDIITDASFSYTSNINYTSFQGNPASNTGNSVGVFKFIIRDGGGAVDADALGTELTAITFNVTNIANVRSAALFASNGTTLLSNAATINTGLGTIAFTGLSGTNVTALDGGTQNVTLRVSFLTSVTDKQQLQYTIATVTANTSGSSFAATNAGGATSSVAGDINRINVLADRLRFTTQPVDQALNTNLVAFVVQAVDANNNVDLDAGNTFTLTTSGTGMTSGSPYTLVNGAKSIADVKFSAVQGPITLTALTTGLAFDNADISSSFYISNVTSGSYRTIGPGTWNGTATWQRFTAGWVSSSAPTSGNTTDMIYIRHSVSFGGSMSFGKITIESGGTLSTPSASTISNTLLVKEGGTLQANAALTVSGVFEVEDDGNVVLQSYLFTNNSAIWNGTEIFHSNSNFIIYEWGANSSTSGYRPLFNGTNVSTNTYNGYTAAFGNIKLDLSASSEPNSFAFLSTGVSANLAHGNIVLANPVSGRNISFLTSGTATSGIGGTLTVDDLFSPTDKVIFASAGNLAFTIKGNLQLDGATTVITTSSAAGTVTTVSVEGDINITPAAVLDYSITVAGGSPAPAGIINLNGDITVYTSGLFRNSNTSSVGTINFYGTGDGLTAATTQTIDIASTGASRNRYINFFVNSGAYVQLANRNLELGTSSSITIKGGGTFDFYFNSASSTIENNITLVSGATSTGFTAQQGCTLKVSSPGGLYYDFATYGATVTSGNVQGIVKTSRSLSPICTFWFTGKANQVTGDCVNPNVSTSADAKVVICDLASNSLSLTPTISFGLTKTTTLSPTGGKLDMRVGQFIEATSAYIFAGDGTLYMNPGTLYRITKGSSDTLTAYADPIPRMSGGLNTYPYVLNGGTIELAGTGLHENQVLRSNNGTNCNYKYVHFSGANSAYNGGGSPLQFKAITGTVTIDSALLISNNAIVNSKTSAFTNNAASFDGSGGLIMTGGWLMIKKLNTTNPELTATSVGQSYSLTGGTIEFYGSGATQQQQIRGKYGPSSTNVAYYNLEINAGAANYSTSNAGNVDLSSSFILQNVMNVNSPAVLRMDKEENISGAGNFNINSGAGLMYGGSEGTPGSDIEGLETSGTTINSGNIRTTNRSFSTGASYGFISAGDMPTGPGLPTTVAGLYAYKTNATDKVTFSNPALVSGIGSILNLSSGVLVTTSTNLITLKPEAVVSGGSSSSFVSGPLAKQTDATNTPVGNYEFAFPIGKTGPTQYKPAYVLPATASGTTTYTAEFFPANPASSYTQPYLGSLMALYKFDYWKVDRGTTQTGTARVAMDYVPGAVANDWVFQGGASSPPFIPPNTNVAIAKHFGTYWNFTKSDVNFNNVGPMFEARYYNSTGKIYTGVLNSFSPFAFGYSYNVILPIQLLSFTGRQVAADGRLEWNIADARDLEGFELQYSRNGSSYQKLAAIAGNGALIYSFLHKDLPAGTNYYRLLLKEKNGRSYYSAVVLLHAARLKTYLIGASPTMGGAQMSAAIFSATAQQIQISLLDALGRQVVSSSLKLNQGANQWNIPTGQLVRGLYFITFQSEDGFRQTVRFVKE